MWRSLCYNQKWPAVVIQASSVIGVSVLFSFELTFKLLERYNQEHVDALTPRADNVSLTTRLVQVITECRTKEVH